MKEAPFEDLKKRTKGTKSHVQILFDGKSFIGESKESIISLLGSPNSSYSEKKKRKKDKNKEQIYYYITTCDHKRPGDILVIFISDNKVIDSGFVIMD